MNWQRRGSQIWLVRVSRPTHFFDFSKSVNFSDFWIKVSFTFPELKSIFVPFFLFTGFWSIYLCQQIKLKKLWFPNGKFSSQSESIHFSSLLPKDCQKSFKVSLISSSTNMRRKEQVYIINVAKLLQVHKLLAKLREPKWQN